MPKNTLISLLIAYASGLVGGLLSLLLALTLFSDHFKPDPNDLFASDREIGMIVGLVLSFICPFFFSIGILLPLAAIDKKKLEELTFTRLLLRYAPLLTMPFGILFLFLFLAAFSNESEKYSTLVLVFTLFGICFSSLWFFVRRLKS